MKATMYRTMLLAYDGSRECRRALKEGAELAQLCGSEVHLLAVVRSSPGMAFAEAAEPSGLVDQEAAHFEAVLQEGLELLHKRGLVARGTLRKGTPAEEIVAMARDVGADLIVLGHNQRSGIARWWRGSTGGEILANAPCSVFVAVNKE
jgi:nucleotide-binding universal stress UspA family protein